MDVSVIKTAKRVFEVLELFREERRPLSVREIAESLDYPFSSTSVLMRSISSLGYVSYNRKLRAFFPTVRVATLGNWVYESVANGDALAPMLEELAQRTGAAAFLAVQNDIFSQFIEVKASNQQMYLPPGTRQLLCLSATGWALLAALPDESVRKIVHRTNLQYAQGGNPISYERLLVRIKKIRKQGYSLSRGLVNSAAGIIAMALPADPKDRNVRLAVAVGGRLEDIKSQEAKLVGAMRDTLKKYRLHTVAGTPSKAKTKAKSTAKPVRRQNGQRRPQAAKNS